MSMSFKEMSRAVHACIQEEGIAMIHVSVISLGILFNHKEPIKTIFLLEV